MIAATPSQNSNVCCQEGTEDIKTLELMTYQVLSAVTVKQVCWEIGVINTNDGKAYKQGPILMRLHA